MTDVVLVHGAWHGAWCFDRVVAGLTERGVGVTAFDMPGHGDDPGPLTDLHGDAARLSEVLDRATEPVVLLGHSYGGAAITAAGDHDAVHHLVFLAAFALEPGESCMAAATDTAEAANISWEGRPNLVDAFAFDEAGLITLSDTTLAAAAMYNDCDEASIAWALERLCPQRLVTLEQTPGAAAWHTKPSTYVVCTEDAVVHPDLQRIMAARCTTSVEWPTSHSPFMSRPDLMVDLLAELASN